MHCVYMYQTVSSYSYSCIYTHVYVQNGWTETLAELIHVTPEALVPAQVTHEAVDCEQEKRVALFKYLYKQLLAKNNEAAAGVGFQVPFQTIIFVEEPGEAEDLCETLRPWLANILPKLTPLASSTDLTPSTADDAEAGSNYFRKRRARLSGLTSDQDSAITTPAPSTPTPTMPTQLDHTTSYDSTTTDSSTSPLDAAVDDQTLIMRLEDDTLNIDQRAESLNHYRKGTCRILVCTDLAARGLDVPDTSLVIQVGS